MPGAFKYAVRFISSPERKGKAVTRIWHDTHNKFISELKDGIRSSFNDKLAHLSDFQCGYMEKTVKRWIECDKDLDAMYGTCKIGDEILLWCDNSDGIQGKKKRKSKDAIGEPVSKRERKESTIDEITKQLQEKHGEA